MTTMKVIALLLLATIPLALARLGNQNERRVQENARRVSGKETFATNRIIATHFSEEYQSEKVLKDSKHFPFQLESLDRFDDQIDNNPNSTDAIERRLDSGQNVTIKNQCSEQAFWLAVIYRDASTGRLVHDGWISVESNSEKVFHDVLNGEYAMYAMSHDFRFKWGGDPNTARYCFYSRCYKDFSFPGVDSFQYLSCCSCNYGGPSPTPAPTPAPTPPPVNLSSREQEWVDAHNSRRQAIHSQFGKPYQPLQWSREVADSAQGYADLLATVTSTECFMEHGYQGNSYGGENIAANWGSSSYEFESPEAVLTRWFEDEAYDPWPQNGHRTQVAWRGSKYVGCGEARKVYDGYKVCKIQVCRYLAPGNCNIGSKPLDHLMMDDYSPCSPQSPSS